jgi:hypothetical protein
MQIGIDLFIVSIIMLVAIYSVGYYMFIYLNRMERKFDIKKPGYDNWFSRMHRVNILIIFAFTMKWKFLGEKIAIEAYKGDWYGGQYLKKVPYEAIQPYRTCFFLVLLFMILPFATDFLSYMGWDFSFYW